MRHFEEFMVWGISMWTRRDSKTDHLEVPTYDIMVPAAPQKSILSTFDAFRLIQFPQILSFEKMMNQTYQIEISQNFKGINDFT